MRYNIKRIKIGGGVMEKRCFFVMLILFVFLAAGCGKQSGETKAQPPKLVVYCTMSSPLIESLVNEFEKQYDVRVDLIAGDAVYYPEDAGEADVFMGIAPALAEENPAKFRLYSSENAQEILSEFRRIEDSVTTFAAGSTVLLVNTNLAGDIPVTGYRDLLRPELAGQVTMPNPAFSATGCRHLLNILATSPNEDDGWLFVRRLLGNRLMRPVASATEAASAVADGRATVAMTTEAAALTEILAGSPVRMVYMREGILTYELGVSIATLTPYHKEAENFVDFLTSRSTQFVLARQFHFRPVHKSLTEADAADKKRPVVSPVNAETRRRILDRFAAYAAAAEAEP